MTKLRVLNQNVVLIDGDQFRTVNSNWKKCSDQQFKSIRASKYMLDKHWESKYFLQLQPEFAFDFCEWLDGNYGLWEVDLTYRFVIDLLPITGKLSINRRTEQWTLICTASIAQSLLQQICELLLQIYLS